MPADLHCHTYCSDGSDSPEEVVLLAKYRGLSAVAVTDHYTFSGGETAAAFGKKYGMGVISGVEFSTCDTETGRKAHILAYLCDELRFLSDICRATCEARREAGEQMLEKVQRFYPIPALMVMRRAERSASLYKQHIMRALMDAGYVNEMYGEEYKKLFAVNGGAAYVPVQYPEVHEVIERIHRAGGLAVLAHPSEYDGYDLLKRLASAHEIDGVEVCHPSNCAGDEEKFTAVADEYDLAKTGGTDFHGMYRKLPVPLGTCTTADDQLEKLLAKKK